MEVLIAAAQLVMLILALGNAATATLLAIDAHSGPPEDRAFALRCAAHDGAVALAFTAAAVLLRTVT